MVVVVLQREEKKVFLFLKKFCICNLFCGNTDKNDLFQVH